MPRLPAVLALAIALSPGMPTAHADTFDVSFAGVRAGTLVLQASEAGGRYEARGAVRPSGLGSLAFDTEIDTFARGRVSGNRYSPAAAREITRNDGETVERVFDFSSGVPKMRRTPRKRRPDYGARPRDQAGTIDVTTAAFAILRDRPADLACALDIAVYDGERRHRIVFERATPTGDGLICEGVYRREAGFSPKAMAERTTWPLQMDYARQADGSLRVQEVSFPTSFGSARIRRR